MTRRRIATISKFNFCRETGEEVAIGRFVSKTRRRYSGPLDVPDAMERGCKIQETALVFTRMIRKTVK